MGGFPNNTPYAALGAGKVLIDAVAQYGADPTGVADASTAIQSAITAGIATGGTVLIRAGTYLLNTGLDFSAMKGGGKQLLFAGAGGGTGQPGQSHITDFAANTIFLNASGNSAIKAAGVAPSQPIVGLALRGFAIKNTADLGSNFTISLDYATERGALDDIYVYANGHTGNGIAFMNFPLGQGYFERVVVEGFGGASPNGIGIKISAEVTAGVASVPNCGNMHFRASAARDCRIGWYLTSTNLLNGMTFTSCKAVNIADIATSIGFYLSGSTVMQNVFEACHSEWFNTGFAIQGGRYNTILNPLVSYPGGTPENNTTAGVRVYSTAYGNRIIDARVSTLNYGVSFEGNAQSNWASGNDVSGARCATSFFRDTSALATNITQKIEDGATLPVISFPGHSVQVAGAEVLTAVDRLASGEPTIERTRVFSAAAVTLSTGIFRLTYFTAKKTEAITQIRIPSGSTAAAATPTLCRVGIYSLAANGDGTLVTGIVNDTALWASTNTDYLRSLSATFNKVANTRYAIGWIVVTGATAPAMPGLQIMAAGTAGANAAARAPRLAGALTAQADLPDTFTEASLVAVGAMQYAELVP